MNKKLLSIFIITCFLFAFLANSVYAAESAFDQEGEASAAGSAFEDSSSSGSSSGFADKFNEKAKSLDFAGELRYYTRLFLEKDGDSEVDSYPQLDLDLTYENDNSEMIVNLNIDDNDSELEEGFIRLYYDKFNLEVGKKKVVWGKGDKMHVVDNLNAVDYSDFINPDYLDRKVAEEMIKLNYYLGTGSLELVYTPEFTTNSYAEDGYWAMESIKELGEFEVEDYNGIDDAQFAVRYTNTVRGYDYGVSFYQGRLREPSIDQDKNRLSYDRVSILGAEFGSVLVGINSRAEVAYYLTDDTEGDDPYVHNNKLAWVIGGDRDLAYNNLNINLQLKSNLILDDDQITNSQDVDYSQDDDYLTNTLSLGITDSYKHETILPELSLAYNVEDEDYMIEYLIEFILKDDTSCIISYKNFNGEDDTQFGQFDDNDFLSVEFEYSF